MLSDAEAEALNRRGAEAMGWKRFERPDNPNGDESGNWYWITPGGMRTPDVPDFCRDAHALGWMVEWMTQVARGLSWGVGQDEDGSFWCLGNADRHWSYSGQAIGEALLRAVIAYAESQSAESENPNGQ